MDVDDGRLGDIGDRMAGLHRVLSPVEILQPGQLLVIRPLLPGRATDRGVGVVAEGMALAMRRLRREPLREQALLGESPARRCLLATVAERHARILEGGYQPLDPSVVHRVDVRAREIAISAAAAATPAFNACPKENCSGGIETI